MIDKKTKQHSPSQHKSVNLNKYQTDSMSLINHDIIHNTSHREQKSGQLGPISVSN